MPAIFSKPQQHKNMLCVLPRNVFCVSSSSDKTFAKNAIHLVLRDEPITTVHAKNKLIFPKV